MLIFSLLYKSFHTFCNLCATWIATWQGMPPVPQWSPFPFLMLFVQFNSIQIIFISIKQYNILQLCTHYAAIRNTDPYQRIALSPGPMRACKMPWSHLQVKVRPVITTWDKFREIEWHVSIMGSTCMWLLWDLRGCYEFASHYSVSQ